MQVTFDSVSDLAQALRRAEAAHGQHEAQIGHPDPDWPTWYAQYMFDEQTEHLDRAMQREQAVRQEQDALGARVMRDPEGVPHSASGSLPDAKGGPA